MDAPSKPLAADLSPAESRRWMGRLLIAVILGAAVWNFVAALTSAVIVPGLARVMESDLRSPLSLGKGDFNVPAIFASVIELCLAAIAALLVSSWAQRRPRMARRKSPSVAPAQTLSIAAPPAAPVREPVSQTPRPVSAPATPSPAPQPVSPPPTPAAPVVTATPAPPKPIQPEKPAPKKPKEVYYNLVGEPVDPDE